jgi:hypothetical protein
LDAAIGINTGNPDFGNRPGQRAGVQPICSMSSICDGANAGAIPFRRSFWVVIEAGGVEMVFIGSTSFRSDATIRRLLKCAIR